MAGLDRSQRQTVFSVRLDGITLPLEANNRISAAIQRAVLSEFAELDLTHGFHVQNLNQPHDLNVSPGGGEPQGIAIVADVPQREV